jgi:hypothetical protein
MFEYDVESLKSFKPNLFQKIWWPILRFIKDIPDKPAEVKYWFQRANKGYDDSYYWGLDYKLVEIIPPILKDLKEKSHGFPGGMSGPEEWDRILDKLIKGWEAAKRVCDDEYYLKTGFPEKKFDGDVKIWYAEMKKDQKIFEEMMPLFTKYFFHLWD